MSLLFPIIKPHMGVKVVMVDTTRANLTVPYNTLYNVNILQPFSVIKSIKVQSSNLYYGKLLIGTIIHYLENYNYNLFLATNTT